MVLSTLGKQVKPMTSARFRRSRSTTATPTLPNASSGTTLQCQGNRTSKADTRSGDAEDAKPIDGLKRRQPYMFGAPAREHEEELTRPSIAELQLSGKSPEEAAVSLGTTTYYRGKPHQLHILDGILINQSVQEPL